MEVNVPDSHISANGGQDLKPGLSDAKAEFPSPASSPATLLISIMVWGVHTFNEGAEEETASKCKNSLSGYTFAFRWNWDPRGPTCSIGLGICVCQIQRLTVFKCFVGGLLFPFCFPLIFLMLFLKFSAWFIWTKGTQEGTGAGEEGAEAAQPWGVGEAGRRQSPEWNTQAAASLFQDTHSQTSSLCLSWKRCVCVCVCVCVCEKGTREKSSRDQATCSCQLLDSWPPTVSAAFGAPT